MQSNTFQNYKFLNVFSNYIYYAYVNICSTNYHLIIDTIVYNGF